MKIQFRSAVLLLFAFLASAPAADIIPLGSSWSYFLGTQEASTPVVAWRETGFDDSSWPIGFAPLGYDTGGTPGTAPLMTWLPDPRTAGNPYWNSAYFRKTFNIADPARIASLALTLYVDDGAVAWVNGVQVGRLNVPDGELPHTASAIVAGETLVLTTTNIAHLLVPGANSIAVHVFNAPVASSDFVFEAVLTAVADEPPAIALIDPYPSSIVTRLDFINVTFTENVTGVDASDLRINGSAATNVAMISPREYIFTFPQPPTGSVSVTWSPDPQITDSDYTPDPFIPTGNWTYTLDPNAIPEIVVISEFMADNEHGITDEDGTRNDWLELFNPGTEDVNLEGWFLTDTATNLTKWRIPAVNLGANNYLLILASAKNRTNPAAPLHTNFKISKAAGSYLALVDPQTNVVSDFTYPAQSVDVSYGRDRVDFGLFGYFVVPTPGAQNSISGSGFAPSPIFSHESGTYTNDSITLAITAPMDAIVRYTLDGSEPTTNSLTYGGPLTFSTNTIVKARVFQTGVFPSAVGARTFVMLDSTTRDFNSNIPVMIISTPGRAIPRNLPPGAARTRGNLVSMDTFRGRTSLRATPDFHGLAGFEIVGQTSADFIWNGIPKPPYRIELHDELGNDLDSPLLGMPPEADWVLRSPFTDKCLMNDYLGYELWEDLGYYSSRRRFVELFVDTGGGKLTYPGDYLGVYVLCERIKIGKDRVDISRLTPFHTNEPAITGGYIIKKDKDSTGDVNFTTTGGAGHSGHVLKYHDPKGTELTSAQAQWIRDYLNRFEATIYAPGWTNAVGSNHYSHYIDVDAFVDQHLHVEFTKNIDGYRLSSFYVKDRGRKLRPEPVWDWNLSFGNANYLQGGKTNGWYWNLEYEADAITSFKHTWLRRLVYGLPVITSSPPWTDSNGPGDPDFRQRITDRWAVLRTNIFNAGRVVARIDELATVLAEPANRHYARFANLLNSWTWPNPEGPPAFDVDYTQPTYAAIISEMKKWTQGRWMWMDQQFIPTPVLSRDSSTVSPGVTVEITAPLGTVYYTLDGTDPRLPGGGISPTATIYSAPINLSGNARLVARAYLSPTTLWTTWSAPIAATYVVTTPLFVITEIMYHPSLFPGATNLAEEFEYIEFKNVGSTSLDLRGFSVSGGIELMFPSFNLAPGGRVLAVKNRAAFTALYGNSLPVVAEFAGQLANDGDHVVLLGPLREPILDFHYDDAWYPITDGPGFSLVIINEDAPASSWGQKSSWRPSGLLHGSPGAPDPASPAFPPVVINEALTHTIVPPPTDTVELHNLSDVPANIGGWFLTDNFAGPRKFRIPIDTVIPARGYLTIDESQFNVPGLGNAPFALSSGGEEVYLFSGDADGNLTGYYHGFTFPAARGGVTFGRHVLSTGEEHFVPQTVSTLGKPNSTLLIGPIIISEVMYHPPDVFTNNAGWNNTEDEFVELRNISSNPVDLFDPSRPQNTWKLGDEVEFSFPTNTTLPAGSYALVVSFNPLTAPAQLAAFRATYGIDPSIPVFGPYSVSLDNRKGTLAIYMPDIPELDGTVPYVPVDRVHYLDESPWPLTPDGLGHSLQRVSLTDYADDPINWTGSAPTPGAPMVTGLRPSITMNPISQTVPASGSVTFLGSATGPGSLRYQWQINETMLPGATNSFLVLSNVQMFQAGSYRLLALNEFGSAVSQPATLTVLVPATILAQPASLVVTNGGDAAFSVAATTANPPLAFQWFLNGLPLPGATNSGISFTNVEEALHGGEYVVAISDALTTIYSAPAILTILLPPSLVQPVPPMRITTVAGQNVHLGANALGTRPMLFRWRRVLTNGASAIIANHYVNSHVDFMTISNVAPVFNGAYFTVTLTNAAFFPVTRVFTNCFLTVLPDSNTNGIPDSWESTYFGSATGAQRDADSDGDTMSNWTEYLAGTDPTNAASCLKVDFISATAGANITWGAVSNRSYTVQYCDDVASQTWNRLAHVVARSTDWTATVNDPAPATNRYYRLITPKSD